MKCNLAHSRRGVSTYIQTFILVGVTLGGSSIAYSTVTKYASSTQGPSIAVADPSVVQGSGVAVERLTVSNTGSTAFTSFTISTPGLSGSYCYSLKNALSGGTILAASPPCALANPSSVTATTTVSPGGAVTIALTIIGGNVFTPGTSYNVLVSTSNAAQVSLKVVAVQA
jgi:hypothetical protein